MNYLLLFAFIFIFMTIGGGGIFFWRQIQAPSRRNEPGGRTAFPVDAVLGPWLPKGSCSAHSGTCGKGEITMERKCIQEGRNGGKTCLDFGEVEKIEDCYVDCQRPKGIVDWGHANDSKGIPPLGPHKGWYDFTGQGQPNDFCRWVGEDGNKFWACHTSKGPYVKGDPTHITFSAGPANKLKIPSTNKINKVCPVDAALYRTSQDPDFLKSIANGFTGECGTRCVYDHRNPKTGWSHDGKSWVRIDDMSLHKCGAKYVADQIRAINTYEKLYDVKHSWTVL